MPHFRRRLACVLLALLLAATIAPARADDPSSELMAAYVYNFARFVEWPAAQFLSKKSPLILCTPDTDALDGHLLRIHGRMAKNRRVVVRIVDEGNDLADCHLLFLPKQEDVFSVTLLETAADKPLLTISNAPGFTESGGMIGLFVQADRVHFDINRELTQSVGLRVSSRLLALARVPPRGAK